MKQRLPKLDVFINEQKNTQELLRDLHFAQNSDDANKIKQMIAKEANWTLDDVDYMFKKFRKEIGYSGPEFYDPDYLSYDDIYNPNTPYRKFLQRYSPFKTVQKKWTEQEYKRWIKNMSANGGTEHAYDMAQMAKYENGLLDFVRRKIKNYGGDETPFERIQWDIENHAK